LRFGIFLQNYKGFIIRAPTCMVQCSQVLFIVGSIPPAGIETLPQELQRNFTLMRDLDQRAEGTYSTPTCNVGTQDTVSGVHSSFCKQHVNRGCIIFRIQGRPEFIKLSDIEWMYM